MEGLLGDLAGTTCRAVVHLLGGILLVSVMLYIPSFIFGVPPTILFQLSPFIRRLGTPWPYDLLESTFGLVDDPDTWEWLVMFWATFSNSIHGFFGVSWLHLRPVSVVIAERMPYTLLLLLSAAILAMFLLKWQVHRAAQKRRGSKYLAFFESAPPFWFGMVLLLFLSFLLPNLSSSLFGIQMGLPQSGIISHEVWVIARSSPYGAILLMLDISAHLVLPTIAMGLFIAALLWRIISRDTEFCKGKMKCLSYGLALNRASIAEIVPVSIGASILVEVAFSWNGVGQLLFHMILYLDFATLLGCFVHFITLAVAVIWVIRFLGALAWYLLAAKLQAPITPSKTSGVGNSYPKVGG